MQLLVYRTGLLGVTIISSDHGENYNFSNVQEINHEMKERRMKKRGIYQIIVQLSVKFTVVNVMIYKTVYMYANP